MIFDEDFVRLTGAKDFKSTLLRPDLVEYLDDDDENTDSEAVSDNPWKEKPESEKSESDKIEADKSDSGKTEANKSESGKTEAVKPAAGPKKRLYEPASSEQWSSEYGNPNADYVIESNLVTPKIEISRSSTKPIIVYVDDDFDSLDLLKVYLQRDYEYRCFADPKKAIFYLNNHVPALVILDCRLCMMKIETFMSIVRTGDGNENTRFVLTGTKEELARIERSMTPDYVLGLLEVPVKRGDLQKYLDMI